MRYHSYACVECGEWNNRASGYKEGDGILSVKCSSCGNVEKIQTGEGVTG